jgi:hypothetical protein
MKLDLAERVERSRFIGQELLVWLWFKTELFEGNAITEGDHSIEAWLDTQLVLESASDKRERTTLRGMAPSASPEAKLALLRGKLPVSARVCMTYDGRDYAFVFDARDFALTGIALPEVLTEDEDDRFPERMALIEGLYAQWYELYAEFLALRTARAWETDMAPSLLAWATGRPRLTQEGYRALVRRVRK